MALHKQNVRAACPKDKLEFKGLLSSDDAGIANNQNLAGSAPNIWLIMGLW